MRRIDKKFVVVDIETTGNTVKKGERIIQIAAVVIEAGEITRTFSSFVQPEKKIPPFITELTGITDEMVADAPLFKDITTELFSLFENAYFVAHNVMFDWNFLQDELGRNGCPQMTCPKMDTVELARMLLPTADSYKLGDLAVANGLIHENPHQADSDAFATAELLLLFLDKIRTLPLVTLQQLQKLCKYFQSDVGMLVSAIVMEKMRKANEDERNFEIYRGLALKKQHISFDVGGERIPSFLQYVRETMPVDFSLHNQQFEIREGQLQIMEAVYESFSHEKTVLIEAGTGIGKSFGYLVPSIFFAKEAEQPVVISTKTTQLQHQLMEKEVPFLKKVLSFPFEVALLKGRSHYLCLQKFEKILQEEDNNYENVLTKAKILVWLLETETGDADELHLSSGGELLWQRVCVDAYSKKGINPWKAKCFYEKAVNRLFIADIIITNHTVLLQKNEQENLLSSYEYVVIDEAHHLEEVASKVYGRRLFAKSFYYHLNRAVELLPTVKEAPSFQGVSYLKLERALEEIKFESDELFQLLYRYVLEKNPKVLANRVTYRFQIEKESKGKWQVIMELANRMLAQWQIFSTLTKQIEINQKNMQIREWLFIVEALQEAEETIRELLLTPCNGEVTWMEIGTKGTFHSFFMYSQPVSIAEMIQEKFFQKKKSAILTSGTLTVHQKFDYMRETLGLMNHDVGTMQIPSPFPYDQLVQLYLPTNLPNIRDVSEETYGKEIALALAKVAQVTKGKMLVLFTSQAMLNKTYYWTKELASLQDFVILAQGVNNGSRMRLMKQFQKFKKTILFGTTSFWEGIDISGDSLQCLVIVRLPFSPPDSPVTEAKIETIKETGGNPFQEYALPQAIIRFKQGFGRLIRSQHEKGIVMVLDKRITSTFYGRKFLQSIPNVPTYEGNLEDMIQKIGMFLVGNDDEK